MATQICPKCKSDSFTWIIDDEISNMTIWYCNVCNFSALENENDESNCFNIIRSNVSNLLTNVCVFLKIFNFS
jgi:ribosomal protein L37AE/L43A